MNISPDCQLFPRAFYIQTQQLTHNGYRARSGDHTHSPWGLKETYILKEVHKFVNVFTTGEVHYVLQLQTSGKYQGLLIMHA